MLFISARNIPRVLRFYLQVSPRKAARTMRIEKRIQTLESKMLSGQVILHFDDGTARTLIGPRYFLLDLFVGACGGRLDPNQQAQLDLIRRCVSAKEPGGGRMVEAIQGLINEPIEPSDC
jgi:hypothetical protein